VLVHVTQALTAQQHGVLLHRLSDLIGFSSERALVNLQVVALDQDPVSRQQVSCRRRGQRVHFIHQPQGKHVLGLFCSPLTL